VVKKIGLMMSVLPYWGGTYQWTLNILKALSDFIENEEHVQVIIFHSDRQGNYNLLKKRFPSLIFIETSRFSRIFSTILINNIFVHLPILLPVIRMLYPQNALFDKNKIDLIIFPGGTLHVAFCNKKNIFMFTDIEHVFYPYFPEVSKNGQLKVRDRVFSYGVKWADQIVVESEQLKRDVVKYYGADESKIDILYQTFSQQLIYEENSILSTEEKQKLELPCDYIYYPAQLWEHKNHVTLLKALKIVHTKFPEIVLILSGSRQNAAEGIFTMIHDLNLEDKVRYLGYVPDSQIPILYRNAKMLVMPTFFGPTNIPTLEAFYYGCPAVISDIPGVTEQTGNAALLFNPRSEHDLAEKIILLLENKSLRDELIQRGYERTRILSFENYKKQFFPILEKNLRKCS
jgi:glycosyltransferase involved in cell wall biosynthesis